MTSSAPGTRASASMATSAPLRGTSRPMCSSRNGRPCGGASCAGRGRGEPLGVHAARHHPHLAHRHAEGDEFGDLVAAGRHRDVAVRADLPFPVDAPGRAGVGGALVAALHAAERVEGVDERDAEGPGRPPGGDAGHPEVRVGQVGRSAGPLAFQELAELRHVGQQLVLGQAVRRPGGHVPDLQAGADADGAGQGGAVAAGVDGHPVAAFGELSGQLGDVHVLAAGVGAAECGQRAGVFGDQGDLQGFGRAGPWGPHQRITSSISRSQSARNRLRPYRASAACRAAAPACRAASASRA